MVKKSSLTQIVIKYYNIIEQWYGFKVAIIHIDGETAFKGDFKECIAEWGISLKISPPYT